MAADLKFHGRLGCDLLQPQSDYIKQLSLTQASQEYELQIISVASSKGQVIYNNRENSTGK